MIILSGDDEGQAFLFRSSSSSPSDWNYQGTTFVDVGGRTIGSIAAGDVDGDGYTEVFVPSYDEGLVYVYTFKP